MNFSAIKIITINTILNEWRSKALLFLAAMTTIVLIIAMGVLSYVNDSYIEGMNIQDLGLKALGIFFVFINFWSYFVSIYFGVSSVKTDTEFSVLPQILSFPIDRSEYLLGRVFGTLAIVMGYYLVSLIFAIIGISFVIKSVVFSPMIIVGFLINIIPNFAVILLSFLFGPYMGKLQSFISMIFLTFFINSSNGKFAQMEVAEMFKYLDFFSSIQLMIHLIFPHVAIWGGLGNAYIVSDLSNFNPMTEIPHLVISVGILYFLVYARFRRVEV